MSKERPIRQDEYSGFVLLCATGAMPYSAHLACGCSVHRARPMFACEEASRLWEALHEQDADDGGERLRALCAHLKKGKRITD